MRLFLIVCLALVPFCALAADPPVSQVGVRAAFHTQLSEEDYRMIEGYYLRDLPWWTRLGEQTTLGTRLDLGVAYFEGGDKTSGMALAGIDLVLGLWDSQLELDVGFRPTLMTDHDFGKDDFGGPVQFTSHLGVNWNIKRVSISYRYSHTSNGGFYDPNPGVNLQSAGLGFRF